MTNIDEAHRTAQRMDAALEDFQWFSDKELVALHQTATSYTGSHKSGWNAVLLARVTELLTERGIKV